MTSFLGYSGALTLMHWHAAQQHLTHDLSISLFALRRGNHTRISQALADIGVETEKQDVDLRTEMAYGMFDTRGKV